MSVQALTCALAIRGVSSSEKLLLMVLANYANEKMQCWPSHRKLADDAALSERTILTLMKGLELRQIISRMERRRSDGSRGTDVITMHFDGGETISPRGENDREGVGKPLQGGGEMASPLTTFEPSTEPMEADASISRDPFASFWAIYPNKVGKRAAEKSYVAALKRVTGPDPPGVILAGVIRAQASRKWLDGIIPNPATWLNQDRWEDQPSEVVPLQPRQAHERPPRPDNRRDAFAERLGDIDAAMAAAFEQPRERH